MNLSVSERIQLVEDIWDSIAAEAPDTVGLSPVQKAELHRRVAAHRADPSTAVPWAHVRSRLLDIDARVMHQGTPRSMLSREAFAAYRQESRQIIDEHKR